jgi:ADP-ribose pyrophosphatase YjhB (NUDIX family)
MGAGVLLTDAHDRVLLVEPAYQDDWGIPGGAAEADELRGWAWCTERAAADRLSSTARVGG